MSRLLLCIILLPALVQAQTASVDATAGGASDSVDITIRVDSDRDGLLDSEEDTLGTDSGNPDTDGDGLSDKTEVDEGFDPLVNQFTNNPDVSGLIDLGGGVDLSSGLRGAWGFKHKNVADTAFLDTSGNAHDATITGFVSKTGASAGAISNAASFLGPGSYLQISPDAAKNEGQITVSFWMKLPPVNDTVYRPILSFDPGGGAPVVALYYRRFGPAGFFLIWAKGNPAATMTGSAFVISDVNSALTRLDDDEWHHVVLTASGQANLAIDGVTESAAQTPGFAAFSGINGGNLYMGAFTAPFAPYAGYEGDLDQFLIYDRILSNDEIDALWNYDGDWDGVPNRVELFNGTNPYFYAPDVDEDGLRNEEEIVGIADFGNGPINFGTTNPGYFDTDGDLFDDYWEARYYSPGKVDPNDATWPVTDNWATTDIIEGDYDSDGLSNYMEMIFRTDPENDDTDGDGIKDGDEASYGSSPLDASAVPLNPADFYGDQSLGAFGPIGDLGVILKANDKGDPKVSARVGDNSTSESERWRLQIGDKSLVSPQFGVVSPWTDLALDPGEYHKVTLHHAGTDPNKTPDYDYQAEIKVGNSGFLLCDPDNLLGTYGDVDLQEISYKTAYLVPLNNYSWSNSYSGGDAVGPRHRKVALNGRPMPDEKPQQEEESDLPDEETYIDAFNLSLNHDTTFAYVPLGASDLVLQASASAAETGFSDRSGLRPGERFDLPFGAGWSSNLCSYVEVVETIGGEAVDPVTVNVVDEAGRSQRFGTVNFQSFFPWPSTRVDKKTYLNDLSRNGDHFVLKKKFGNTLTYRKCKTWFMYSTDRLEGSTKVKRHTYWRLTEARDRYGVRLHYKYDDGITPNEVSLIPLEISSPDRPNQFLVINRTADQRRVADITDSRGNTTVFHYDTTTDLDFETSPGVVGDSGAVPRLTGITYADSTTTSYDYHGGLEVEIDATDPENVRQTLHYHVNVDAITDKRGSTHSFTYAFDQTKEYWDSSVNGTHAAIDLDRLPADVKECVEDEIAERNEPGKGAWKVMYGMPRRVTGVTLPGAIGGSVFAPQGSMRFGETVSFTTDPATTVTDAVGNTTVYEFTSMDAEVVDVDGTSDSVSIEWMVYYLTSRIHHGALEGQPGHLGTETYTFDKSAGLSLASSTDFSGNTTTWEYGDAYAAPHGLGGASTTMTKWADPTAKVDALGRREEYTYGSHRVMSEIDDPYGTVTEFTVDGLGRRRVKDVQEDGATSLLRERYDYQNQRFKAFQTGKTTLAFDSVSEQAWETDLVTGYLPDDRGRLWREVIDPQGLKLVTEHTYDFNNNRTSTLDARGNRTVFEYDKLNRLTRVTHPSAGTSTGEAVTTREIWYDRNGNKAAEIDEEGRFTIHHYDGLNRRVRTIRDMDGAGLPVKELGSGLVELQIGSKTGNDLETTVIYNAVNSATHTIDPGGNVTFTVFDDIRRPIHVFTGLTMAEAASEATATAAAAASTEKTHTEYLYTDAGLAMPGGGGTVDANPGGTAFDSSGFKPTVVIRHDAVKTASDPSASLTTYAAYDALYRPLRTETEFEPAQYSVSTSLYGAVDGNGKEAREIITTVEPGGTNAKATRTVMDGLQRTTSITDGHGTLPATTQTRYSSTGLVWKTTDPLGRESETEYDRAGRPVAAWLPDPLTGVVNRTSPNDPLLGSPRTRTAYDRNGNVTVSINPLGYRWEYEYDARNRQVVERQPTVTATEIIGGQPEQTTLQNPVLQTAYDGVGNVISAIDARGHTTRTFHDQAYRVIAVLTNPVTGDPSTDHEAPGATDIVIRSAYDANGNVVEVLDGNGNATRNQYDALNRLVATATNPVDGLPNAPPAAPKADDIVVFNSYDDAGNLVQVTDGGGHVTGFRHDGLGRKTRTLWDEGNPSLEKVEIATYDGVVQLTRTDPLGRLTTYQYDDLNRVSDILYTGATADNRQYTYDLVGNLQTVTYPNDPGSVRECEQEYDHLDRLTEETSAGAEHIHTYDKANNRRSTNYGSTLRDLVCTYDKLNRLLTCVEVPNGAQVGNATSYFYDLNGNITRKVLPNGSESRSTFDALNRKLSQSSLKSGGGVISSFDYSQAVAPYPSGYDYVGNVLRVVEQYGHASVRNRTLTNTYDRTHRLDVETISETGGSTTETEYDYDDANNRTGKTVTVNSGTPTSWTLLYGPHGTTHNSNQLRSASDGTTTVSFTYDLNGNRATRSDGTTTQDYTWDHENRLTQVDDSALGIFEYAYDHRTRRVLRDESSASGQTDEISFAGGLSVQEYLSGQTQPFVEYIRGSDYGGGIGGVLYTIRGGARSYNAYNSRGDVVSKTDQAETITWQSSYEAYGKRTQEQGTTSDRQRANTKDEDAWGGLNEGMRYRDLEFGIFLSRDPAGFVDGPNVYTYVRQNPWTRFDPLGLYEADGDPRERSTTITRRGEDGVVRVLQPGREFRTDEIGEAYEASQTGDWNRYFSQAKGAGLDQATAKKWAVLGRDPAKREADNRNMDMAAAMGFPAQLNRSGNRLTRIQSREQAKITDAQANNPSSPSQKSQVQRNAEQGAAFEGKVQQQLQTTDTNVTPQITIRPHGSKVNTKVDFASINQSGTVRLTEAKSSQTAPLTTNQKAAYPLIEQRGGTVRGKGKPGFEGGTQIPPTKVEVVRPPTTEEQSN